MEGDHARVDANRIGKVFFNYSRGRIRKRGQNRLQFAYRAPELPTHLVAPLIRIAGSHQPFVPHELSHGVGGGIIGEPKADPAGNRSTISPAALASGGADATMAWW